MSPSKLSSMALSEHPRFTGIPKQQQRPLLGQWGAIKRAFQQWRLLREKRALWRSFCRIAETMGLPMDRHQQTTPQAARLARIRQIEAELRSINYTQTKP